MKKLKYLFVNWYWKKWTFKNAVKLGIDIDGDVVILGKRHPKKYYVNIMNNEFKLLGDNITSRV